MQDLLKQAIPHLKLIRNPYIIAQEHFFIFKIYKRNRA